MNTQSAIEKLSALSSESRLKVFRLLVKHGSNGLSAGEIATRLNIQPNTLSFHLKELHNAGLIQSERNGRHIIYQLEVEGMRSLIHFLTEDCCQDSAASCDLNNSNCC